MSDEAKQFSLHYLTDNVPRAIARTRANLRLMGWARTKLIVVLRTPSPTTPGYEEVTIVMEGRGSRTAEPEGERFTGMTQWQWLRRCLKRGMRVRTQTVGYNFAGGIRHIMPSGSIGLVVGHDGATVKVRFEAVPGHTFAYAPRALVPLSPESSE